MGEERATPSQVRKPMYFGLFILGSIFQVCWVRAPISKAIVKHIQSEIKTENRGSLLWQGLLLEISMVTAGLCSWEGAGERQGWRGKAFCQGSLSSHAQAPTLLVGGGSSHTQDFLLLPSTCGIGQQVEQEKEAAYSPREKGANTQLTPNPSLSQGPTSTHKPGGQHPVAGSSWPSALFLAYTWHHSAPCALHSCSWSPCNLTSDLTHCIWLCSCPGCLTLDTAHLVLAFSPPL